MKLSSIFTQKLSPAHYFTASFFILAVCLDFYVTNTLGEPTLEANFIAKWWWETMGSFRFIEIPIFIIVILFAAYVINYKSKFLALFWVNLLAFNHLMGFLSWFPNPTIDLIYSAVRYEWAIGYFFSFISVFLSLPLTLIQLNFKKLFSKK